MTTLTPSLAEIPEDQLYLCDRWIRSRFNATVKNVTTYVEEFRFSDAAHTFYEFLWHEFCDWYIELIKQRLYYADDPNSRRTVQSIASDILERTMRLLHPIMPFLTEEIWQRLPHEGDSIMVASWPESIPAWDDQGSEKRNADDHERDREHPQHSWRDECDSIQRSRYID